MPEQSIILKPITFMIKAVLKLKKEDIEMKYRLPGPLFMRKKQAVLKIPDNQPKKVFLYQNQSKKIIFVSKSKQRNAKIYIANSVTNSNAKTHIQASACDNHKLKNCPKCFPDSYLLKRVYNTVENGLKRLKIKRNRNILHYLGVVSENQILHHFQSKILAWNNTNSTQMTLTNINIDHIRPIAVFKVKKESNFANHLLNLQPLLKQDDIFKNSKWSNEDEEFWGKKIITGEFTEIYFPQQCFQPSLHE